MDKRASTSTNAFNIDERCTNDMALNPVSPRCRLAGYPANQISILTTYNGQKALLQDVIERRCASNPAFGRPHKVSPAFLSSFFLMFMFPYFPAFRAAVRRQPRLQPLAQGGDW